MIIVLLNQVSLSAEHQEFFIFLQRLLSPVLEAYSGAAVFVHGLSQPMPESDFTLRLFKYLLTRTERGIAAYGKTAHMLCRLSIEMLTVLLVIFTYCSVQEGCNDSSNDSSTTIIKVPPGKCNEHNLCSLN